MRKPKNRQSASTLLSMGHRAYEANRWNPCDYDTVTVIMSPQVGVHKSKVLSRKDAIKAVAKQRRINKVRDQHKIGACVFGNWIAKVLYTRY